jgi:hypothetical protein
MSFFYPLLSSVCVCVDTAVSNGFFFLPYVNTSNWLFRVKSMAKSFFRNVTDQIIGSSKTTDIQIVQAITRFDDEHSRLLKFKREFDKYTEAILKFDNASYRFYDFIRSLTDSTWSQQPTLVQTCLDIRRIRGDHLQQLNKDINSNIDLSFNKFNKMKARIDNQDRIQRDYDKTRKQYQSSVKHDEQTKVDRIKNELEQLKSALNFTNNELRDDLPKFHLDVHDDYTKIIAEVFDIHGKYYKNYYKLYSGFNKKFRQSQSQNSHNNDENDSKEVQSSIIDSDTKKPYCTPLRRSKRKDYKILHQARVIHDYKAEHEDEIDLTKDEYISVVSFLNEKDGEHDKCWEYAEKADGSIGLFPINFAVRLYDNEEKQ